MLFQRGGAKETNVSAVEMKDGWAVIIKEKGN